MSTAPNFNRLAPLYRWMEYFSFGPWLWWCRSAFLPDLSACRHALVLGDGDGRFTARLLRINPDLRVLAVDASPAMLSALERRAAPHAARLRVECSDLRIWQPPADAPPYDLIVTHFFLDCLTTEEVEALAIKLRSAAAPGALWLVSEFAIPSSAAGRAIAGAIVAALYRAFGWITGLAVRRLPQYETALQSAGFTLEKRRDWLGGLLTSQLFRASPDRPAD
jgi:trans-aconitate methyltransferase